jgi:hypothetical protein
MAYRSSYRLAAYVGIAAALSAIACQAAPAPVSSIIVNMDLSKSFATRSLWHLVGVQGPQIADDAVGPVPGKIQLCLQRNPGRRCDIAVEGMPDPIGSARKEEEGAHFLDSAQTVYPRGKSLAPLLSIRTSSYPSFNGNQGEYTQIFAYRRTTDSFERIYKFVSGHNENEETRFMSSGRLRGDIVTAVPTDNAPFGYWVTVNRLGADYEYRQVLRYRSATRYGDNNEMPVIDSEMPNIQRRLGLWRPGMPLPLPARGCAKPRLIKAELWCG